MSSTFTMGVCGCVTVGITEIADSKQYFGIFALAHSQYAVCTIGKKHKQDLKNWIQSTQAKEVNGSNKMWGQEAIIIKLIFLKLNSYPWMDAALLPSRTISARLTCILSTTLCWNSVTIKQTVLMQKYTQLLIHWKPNTYVRKGYLNLTRKHCLETHKFTTFSDRVRTTGYLHFKTQFEWYLRLMYS